MRQLQYWRESDLLVPEFGKSGGRLLYSFNDVIALRTFAYFRESLSLQTIRQGVDYIRHLDDQLDHLARYRLAVDGKVIVWLDPDGNVLNVTGAPGQLRIKVLMADVFAQFTNTQGAQVVDLRRPRPFITVDPETHGGYPVIAGTRVEFDRVASLVDDGVPPAEIKAFYPCVTAAAARDATSLRNS